MEERLGTAYGTWVTVPTDIISELEWLNLHEDENYKETTEAFRKRGM